MLFARSRTSVAPPSQREYFHGAVTRVGVAETAVQHRDPGFNLILTSAWTDPAATDANVTWTRETYAAMHDHFVPRVYVNYLDADDTSAGAAAFGSNEARLTELKRRYDPEGVFAPAA